jgi:hypothetical protein
MSLSTAEATSMTPLSLDQIIDASDDILRGVVTEIWTEPDPNTGMVWTHAQVEVQSVLKGDDELQIVIIEQPGGIWGGKDAIVEGVARFSIGESGYFFVEHLNSGRSVPVGMFQGKFNVIMDPYSKQEITTRFPLHIKEKFDHRFIPLPPQEHRVSVMDFETKISNRISKGWDGNPIIGTSSERLKRINKSAEITGVK